MTTAVAASATSYVDQGIMLVESDNIDHLADVQNKRARTGMRTEISARRHNL